RRRHGALGRQDAALLAPGLPRALALRPDRRRQRRRLAPLVRRAGAVLRRGRAPARRAGRRPPDAEDDARTGAAPPAVRPAAESADAERAPSRPPPQPAPPPPPSL